MSIQHVLSIAIINFMPSIDIFMHISFLPKYEIAPLERCSAIGASHANCRTKNR
jgi:hypothetical protein